MSVFDVHRRTIDQYRTWLGSETVPDVEPVPTFTWKGDDYACIYSWMDIRELQPGGFIPVDHLMLEVLDPMPTEPQPEDGITFQERSFRIRSVQRAAGKYPKLICYESAKGA